MSQCVPPTHTRIAYIFIHVDMCVCVCVCVCACINICMCVRGGDYMSQCVPSTNTLS